MGTGNKIEGKDPVRRGEVEYTGGWVGGAPTVPAREKMACKAWSGERT